MLHQPTQSPDEGALHLDSLTYQQLRRLHQLEDIFRDDPNRDFAIQSAYVTTPDHGVVTVVRWKPLSGEGPHTYSIGFNTTNNDWPSIRYNFDHDLVPGPLLLKNGGGRVTSLEAYTVLPSAVELLEAVSAAVGRNRALVSYHIPAAPNLRYGL